MGFINAKKIVSLILLVLMVVAIFVMANSHDTVFAQNSTDVVVCHKDGHSGNYSRVDVSIHSVSDANGLNGHGNHTGDVWAPYTYNGVNYSGQGNYTQFNFANCSLLATTTPTATPTPTPNYNNHDNHDNDDHDDHDNHDHNHHKTPTPTPTVVPLDCDGDAPINDPNDNDNDCGTPTPTATTTPTVTPTPTATNDNSNSNSSNSGSNGGSVGAPTCGATKPATPVILSAVQNGSNVTLTWSAVPNATYYSIIYGDIPGQYNYGDPNVGNITSFTVGSLKIGTVYHFAVIAVNDCMPSDPGVLGGGTGGQVLGASTMADTGTFDETFYLTLALFGVLLATSGALIYKKA